MGIAFASGTEVSRYRIAERIGAGGMGEVYSAKDPTLGRQVALKILPPELVENEDRVARFVREAKTASGLDHPHIVTIYEIGEAEVSTDCRRVRPSSFGSAGAVVQEFLDQNGNFGDTFLPG